jgi:hypothetical protein
MPSISRKSRRKSRKTISANSNNNIHSDPKEQLIVKFLVMTNMIKLFHWKTHNYAAHKASDELFSAFNGHMDKFVEVLLGKMNGKRINLTRVNSIPLIDFPIDSSFNENMVNEITSFKSYLVDLEKIELLDTPDMTNVDLWTIRDEILASLNQFLYLLSLK